MGQVWKVYGEPGREAGKILLPELCTTNPGLIRVAGSGAEDGIAGDCNMGEDDTGVITGTELSGGKALLLIARLTKADGTGDPVEDNCPRTACCKEINICLKSQVGVGRKRW